MEIITSRTNSKIKNIVSLVNNKKERLQKNLFVIEGFKILKEAINNKIEIESILLTEDFWQANKYELNLILTNNMNIVIITYDICKKISNNVTPQGIFAICKIPSLTSLKTVIGNGKNILMIVGLQDVGNFGTIIRTANALGVDYILTSKDCPDIYSCKVLRSAMGAAFSIPVVVVDDVVKTMEMFKNNGFSLYASAVTDDCENIKDVVFDKKSVVVVGNEGNGLSSQVINCCDYTIKIPMVKKANSLNVAVATGILLWELKFR